MEMKEAIEILEELQKFLKKLKTIEEAKTIQKALDEAFKALAYTEFMKGQLSCNMSDLIYRQAAIDAIRCDITITGRQNAELVAATIGAFADRIKALPSAQLEPAIPISWLEKEVERLESRKNSFAVLDAVQLKALIKRWESEQNENT